MDGGDNTDDTIGGALQNFNLEAVQEFKIQTMQYKAEYGRSSGGVLSVVTKTGTNDFHGSAYELLPQRRLRLEDRVGEAGRHRQAELDRKQYGASFGGPIGTTRPTSSPPTRRSTAPPTTPSTPAAIFPTFDGQTVELPFTDELVTAKASVDVNARQYLQVRYGYQKNDDKYGASPLARPSSLGTHQQQVRVDPRQPHRPDRHRQGQRVRLPVDSKFDNAITADSHDPPLIYYPGGFHTGQNLNTPQTTSQRKYQYKDDFSCSTTLGGRRHD